MLVPISSFSPTSQRATNSPAPIATRPPLPNTYIGRVRNRFMNHTVSRSISTRKVRSMP